MSLTLAYDLADPAALFQSQAEGRAAAARASIVQLEVARCIADATPIPADYEAIVAQTFLRGTVK